MMTALAIAAAVLFVIALGIAFLALRAQRDPRCEQRLEPTELGQDEDHVVLPFRSVGSYAADVVGKIDRRRA